MNDNDVYDLGRFLTAQAGTYETALAEVRAGAKRSHWMWFVLPQLAALGRSDTARFYGLSGLDEARAYLAHPVLGGRLREATHAVLGLADVSIHGVFGSPDDLKFRSCMSLFAQAAGPSARSPFRDALDRFHGGEPDPATTRLIG